MNYLKSTVKDIGCTDQELENIISFFDRKLPEIYVEFLRIMGRNFESIPRHLYCDLAWKNFDYAKESGNRMIKTSRKSIVLKKERMLFSG